MLITNQFVMLNFPKTGSSFARKTLVEIHARRFLRARAAQDMQMRESAALVELMLPKIDEAVNHGVRDQHGVLRQIPAPHRNKQIVSITRNPFARYVSTYLHRWWAEHPPADPASIRDEYVQFPDLSFAEYYDMVHKYGRANRLRGFSPKADIGLHTIQFIQFYFREPEAVMSQLDDAYISDEKYRNDMADVHFLRQESLRSDLREYLATLGYGHDELDLIGALPGVNVTRRGEQQQDFRAFYTPALVDCILSRDRLLFRLFPEYLPIAGQCEA